VDRETLERLVGEGLSIREIGRHVGRSAGSVRYWLERHGLKTALASSHAERRSGELPPTTRRRCRTHGLQDFGLDATGSYRCRKCAGERVNRRRRRVKQILVEEAGGACRLCGYDGYIGALEFHHLDPSAKAFGLAARGKTAAIELLRAETRKCVLLCSNCHAEVEGGVRALPSELLTEVGAADNL
jgi:hypothetical protein